LSASPGPLPPRPFLYPIVDAAQLGGFSVPGLVAGLIKGGARLLQLRAKREADAELLELAREAVAAAHARGARLVVNDRPDVAVIVGADGVHVGQQDLSPSDARRVLGASAIVGVSTHSLEQARAASVEPVDYVAIGPVFETRSKAQPDPVVGLELLRGARSLVRQPLVAIGGIARTNLPSVVATGVDGVAVISDLLSGPDPETVAGEFAALLARLRDERA
jgi:thiamine-phosphate pyrophosphorylase